MTGQVTSVSGSSTPLSNTVYEFSEGRYKNITVTTKRTKLDELKRIGIVFCVKSSNPYIFIPYFDMIEGRSQDEHLLEVLDVEGLNPDVVLDHLLRSSASR